MRTSLVKIVILFIVSGSLVSCKNEPSTRSEKEIGTNSQSAPILQNERSGDFYEDFEKAADFIANNELDNAIKVYRGILKLDTSDEVAYAGLGACYNLKKEHRESLVYYERSLAIDPTCMTALIGTGSAYSYMHIHDSAILFYDKARELDSQNPEVYWGLAIVYDETGDHAKAKRNAKKFIELAPESKYRDELESILKQ